MTDPDPEEMRGWHARAIAACATFHRAEDRFVDAVGRQRAARLAACDELEMACRETAIWTTSDPCPDNVLATHLCAIVAAYIEVTELERRQITDYDEQRVPQLIALRSTIATRASAIEVRLEEGFHNSATR